MARGAARTPLQRGSMAHLFFRESRSRLLFVLALDLFFLLFIFATVYFQCGRYTELFEFVPARTNETRTPVYLLLLYILVHC